jgi:hypothetical protein
MKKFMFIALFLTAFMFPFFGSISNADALGNYGCGNPDKKTHVNCLRGLLSSTPHGWLFNRVLRAMTVWVIMDAAIVIRGYT